MRSDKSAKKAEARAERAQAQLWLEILSRGIGHVLVDEYLDCEETLRPIIGHANGALLAAIKRAEAAKKAYEPYWTRRRIRIRSPRKTKV